MNESMKDRSVTDEASRSFGPDTGFESESSVSDKAFFQEEAANPVAWDGPWMDNDPEKPAATLSIPASDQAERDTEFGADLAMPAGARSGDGVGNGVRNGVGAGGTIGWIGLILAIVSFFVFRGILGPAAAVVGFMAFAIGRKNLGIWTMGLGLLSFLIFLFTLPGNVS